MKRESTKRGSGKSPYRKYNKQPYVYTHYRCEHRHAQREQFRAELATGAVLHVELKTCAACRVIVDGPHAAR